ncbi:hypothetical protein [Arsenicicoccus sp. oral taxon 190]|uniref:hypothetical protein n=1 Tax=Arsenicicoccus sp. oral taxon 190 TaxID=1658671 RepID=UPI00067A0153|nr:hypothetical protein [Arsenicicoccus sp. oral taxon 190]AKT52155.1 hypothetical protein ADJ73_14315 [Arsenicicoccus sp. oral taxon 190]
MKLLAQQDDAVAVSMHDLEAEVLATAAREVEFMALVDPDALGSLSVTGRALRADLAECRRLTTGLIPGDPDQRVLELWGMLRSPTPQALEPPDPRVADLLQRHGPRLPPAYAQRVQEVLDRHSPAIALLLLLHGLSEAGTILDEDDYESCQLLGARYLASGCYSAALRSCWARLGQGRSDQLRAEALTTELPLTGRCLLYLDTVDGRLHVRVSRTRLPELLSLASLARDSIHPRDERFPEHYRRGLDRLHTDVGVVLRYLDSGPVQRTLWRWGAGR